MIIGCLGSGVRDALLDLSSFEYCFGFASGLWVVASGSLRAKDHPIAEGKQEASAAIEREKRADEALRRFPSRTKRSSGSGTRVENYNARSEASEVTACAGSLRKRGNLGSSKLQVRIFWQENIKDCRRFLILWMIG